jgi:hypothetical protein
MFCWYFKYLISRAADSNRQLSQRTRNHIEHCEMCRKFYSLCRSMDASLREQADNPDSKLSGRLKERIINSVSEKKVKTYKVDIRLRTVLAAAAVIAVVLAGIFVLSLNREKTVPQSDIGLAGRFERLSGIASDLPGLIESPLATEIDNIEEDTESAVRFLIDCVSIRINGSRTN